MSVALKIPDEVDYVLFQRAVQPTDSAKPQQLFFTSEMGKVTLLAEYLWSKGAPEASALLKKLPMDGAFVTELLPSGDRIRCSFQFEFGASSGLKLDSSAIVDRFSVSIPVSSLAGSVASIQAVTPATVRVEMASPTEISISFPAKSSLKKFAVSVSFELEVPLLNRKIWSLPLRSLVQFRCTGVSLSGMAVVPDSVQTFPSIPNLHVVQRNELVSGKIVIWSTVK
jgi:hypothetical protein